MTEAIDPHEFAPRKRMVTTAEDGRLIESYDEPADTEELQCHGCLCIGVKYVTDEMHFFPLNWAQVVITGAGDLIGRHYCPDCHAQLLSVLPAPEND